MTVKITANCSKLQELPIRWLHGDFTDVSTEPCFVGWTDLTILGRSPTSSVITSRSTLELLTSSPTFPTPEKRDNEQLLLIISAGCLGAVLVIFKSSGEFSSAA
jgi:hypothetical protein